MEESLDKIYSRILKLADIPHSKKQDQEHLVLKALSKIELELIKSRKNQTVVHNRTTEILKVVESYAKLKLDKKAYVGDTGDDFDALAAGINMLGEELQSSAISLNEKEILLKEIHHRVKNNLQLVSSLLNLQTELLHDEKIISIFSENKRRIQSMALVHEKLYQSGSRSVVDFTDYLLGLVDSIKQAFSTSKNIEIFMEIEEHNLKLNLAVPCGLIINELLTNSFKYAFQNDKKGKVKLSFKVFENKGKEYYTLDISDNGIGLPSNFKMSHTNTLGLQLVTVLTQQLDGELILKTNPGTSFSISFPR